MKFTQLQGILWLTLCCRPGLALDSPTLPAAHAKASISCFDCHHTQKPVSAAGAAGCMDCHGDAPAVAELTRSLPVNPHKTPAAPHPALGACPDCHRQHQAPVVTCLQCHPTFKFTAK
ncbi:MAG: cytochrome c3 family protein [Holophaga sp.]|nr:cytochrome c3 family protein [Holophaga sp.]